MFKKEVKFVAEKPKKQENEINDEIGEEIHISIDDDYAN